MILFSWHGSAKAFDFVWFRAFISLPKTTIHFFFDRHGCEPSVTNPPITKRDTGTHGMKKRE